MKNVERALIATGVALVFSGGIASAAILWTSATAAAVQPGVETRLAAARQLLRAEYDGDSEGFAVFLDQATNNVVRLKTGQDHMGWVLRSVKGREATLEKNKRTATLTLPVPTALSLGEPASVPAPLASVPRKLSSADS